MNADDSPAADAPRYGDARELGPEQRYVFRRFDDVYGEQTLLGLRARYLDAAAKLPERPATLPDLSVVERDGRVDVLLTASEVAVNQAVLDFVRTNMAPSVALQPYVRAMVVRGQQPNQPWHCDGVSFVPLERPVYAAMIVALEDMSEEMGATEFLVSRLPADGLLEAAELDASVALRVVLKRNQGILFDGRILHRGAGSRRTRAPTTYHVFERS